jgi:hypothetical protein
MAYQVDRFNGTFLVSVDDGTIDTTTDLRFVGKNYAGYGELQNENFLHLLENFANTSPPPKAISGQIWYDSGNKKLKFFDGTRFKPANGSEISSSPPAGMQAGEFWFDSSTKQLYVWDGTEYVLIGPDTPLDLGASAAISAVVKDTLSNNHIILKLISAGETVGIVSKDEFTLNSSLNPIAGFSVIKKGHTLINTDTTTGVTTDDHYFWGTASNTLRLGGIEASEYLRRGSLRFTEDVAFGDSGFTVGDQNDLSVRIVDGDDVVIENQLGTPITFKIRINNTDTRDVVIMNPSSVIPGTNDFYDLGLVGSVWKSVRATTFYGDLVGNIVGDLTGTYRGNIFANDDTLAYDAESKVFFGTIGSPAETVLVYGNVIGDVTGNASNALTLNSLSADENGNPTTIALRDSNANLTANRFIGITDRADRIKIDNLAVDSDPNYKSAKTTSAANSIAARDSSGNLNAVLFQGTATAARYADLAEKYLTDKEYTAGTVVMVGGTTEVTAAVYGKRAIGVVSANPGFMMNKDLEDGTYIALKGRVPVLVKGVVRKGDELIAADTGVSTVAKDFEIKIFAVALESSDNADIKLIEALIL